MPLFRRKIAKKPIQKKSLYHSSHYTVRNVRYLKKMGLGLSLVQVLQAMMRRSKKKV